MKFFTSEYGAISGVVRSVKGKSAKNAAVIQPFLPLHLAWKGRTDLKSVTTIEEAGKASFLKRDHLLSAFYVNELMVRLLQEGEPLLLLFGTYCEVLTQLEQGGEIEGILRKFEKHLLDQLGYGVSYSQDARSGNKLEAQTCYEFVSNVGFIQASESGVGRPKTLIQGEAILAMAVDDYSQVSTRLIAKRVMRQSLASHLGDKPLYSRSLFLKKKKE